MKRKQKMFFPLLIGILLAFNIYLLFSLFQLQNIKLKQQDFINNIEKLETVYHPSSDQSIAKKLVLYSSKDPHLKQALYLTNNNLELKSAKLIFDKSHINVIFPPHIHRLKEKNLFLLEYVTAGSYTNFFVFDSEGNLYADSLSGYEDEFDQIDKINFYSFINDVQSNFLLEIYSFDDRYLIEIDGETGNYVEGSKRLSGSNVETVQ